MIHIAISGASGFVGQNLCNYLKSNFQLHEISRIQLQQIGANYLVNSDTVVHLAGKAHDLKKVSSSDEYYKVNTELTKEIFKAFLTSKEKVFISGLITIVLCESFLLLIFCIL
jgi:nucleoside-diphosphate-sugar epimerase